MRCVLLVLQGEVVLHDLVLVSFVIHCAHQVLETSNVHFAVKDSLEVLKVNFLSKNSVKFRLVCLSVQSLCNSSLVCFVCHFGFDFDKLCVNFLLEAAMITLRRWSSSDLTKTLHLVEGVFNSLFQPPDLLVNQLELAVRHLTRPRRPVSRCTIPSDTASVECHVSLHVLERNLFLHPLGQLVAGELLLEGHPVLLNADL